jgi:hypothetical protein
MAVRDSSMATREASTRLWAPSAVARALGVASDALSGSAGPVDASVSPSFSRDPVGCDTPDCCLVRVCSSCALCHVEEPLSLSPPASSYSAVACAKSSWASRKASWARDIAVCATSQARCACVQLIWACRQSIRASARAIRALSQASSARCHAASAQAEQTRCPPSNRFATLSTSCHLGAHVLSGSITAKLWLPFVAVTGQSYPTRPFQTQPRLGPPSQAESRVRSERLASTYTSGGVITR